MTKKVVSLILSTLVILFIIGLVEGIEECPMKGDSDCDGVVSDFELLDYIDLWVLGKISDYELLEAIDMWANPATTTSTTTTTTITTTSTTSTTTSTTSTTTISLPKLAVDYSPNPTQCPEPFTLYVRPYGNTTALVEDSCLSIKAPGELIYVSYVATNGTYTIFEPSAGVYAVYATKDGWIDSDVRYITFCPV